MLNSQDLKNYHLPDSPGVYLFKNKGDILYIGKATSLKDRVKSYFSADLISTRGPLLVDMLYKADKVDFIKTDSVLEAMILEVNLIKKHQPKYNTKEKDNKSFNYVVITKEDFPRVLVVRGRSLENQFSDSYSDIFGPFTNSTQLKEAIKIIRKIFPFRDKCELNQKRPCFNYQIGLCPGTCTGLIIKKDYQKIIRNIKLFFEGKKKQIIKNLERDMKILARAHEFEKASLIRNKIFALNHIQDIALIKEDQSFAQDGTLAKGYGVMDNSEKTDNSPGQFSSSLRIEAYDAAHLSGTNNVGVMVVMEDGELKKSDYRKFKIQNSKGNDIGALEEILQRRLTHTEWSLPGIIVLDGSTAQLNITNEILKKYQGSTLIHVVAVTKDDRHKAKAIIGEEEIVTKYKKEILLINSEAHRFAIKYHRSKRTL